MLILPRRVFLRLGLGSLGATALAAARFGEARANASPARACIWLWLNGGPSHIDTFDPKPGTTAGGPFKAIATRAKGMLVSEHLPLLANQAHRFSLVRSMTSREGNHDRARYLVHTGYAPTPTVEHPSFGSWTAKELPGDVELPPFVSIGGPSRGAGFLGMQYAPLLAGAGKRPDNVELPPLVDEQRFRRRQQLLAEMDSTFADQTGDPSVHARQAVYETASRMMHSNKLAAFELNDEPESTRASFGDNDFGRGCLVARRLVEAGIRFVEVTLDGWDTHKDNFERTKKLMTTFDAAASSLFADLQARDMLPSTIVVACGEFGRTPKINANDGRDHHPEAWSVLVGGGGVRPGIVVGKTSDDGGKVVERPVGVPDLMATLATALGIDPDRTLSTPAGRPLSLTDRGKVIGELVA